MRRGTAFHRNVPRYYVAVVLRTGFTGWTGFFQTPLFPTRAKPYPGGRNTPRMKGAARQNRLADFA